KRSETTVRAWGIIEKGDTPLSPVWGLLSPEAFLLSAAQVLVFRMVFDSGQSIRLDHGQRLHLPHPAYRHRILGADDSQRPLFFVERLAVAAVSQQDRSLGEIVVHLGH